MVAERRERKAAPSSWIAPEPAGKAKVVKRKAPAARKKVNNAPVKASSSKIATSSLAASGVVAPSIAAAANPPHGVHQINYSEATTSSTLVPTDSSIPAAGAASEGHEDDETVYNDNDNEEDEVDSRAYMGIDEPSGGNSISTSGGNGIGNGNGNENGNGIAGLGGEGNSLFCVCMGEDDGQPMIMCEACENWFHFECINLSEEDASRIATYYCESCEQHGSGKTEWSYDAPSSLDALPTIPLEAPQSSPPMPSKPLSPPVSGNELEAKLSPPVASSLSSLPNPFPLPPMPRPFTPSDSGDEPDNGDDGDYLATSQAEAGAAAATGHATSSRKGKARMSDEDRDPGDDDEDNDDDDDGEAEDTYDERGVSIKRKKKAGTAATASDRGRGQQQQRRKSSSAGTNNAAKRRRRVVEDEEEADERRSKASATTEKFYGKNTTAPVKKSKEADPLLNPTRKHCIEQLEKILQSIFDATPSSSSAAGSVDAAATVSSPQAASSLILNARALAEAAERELFQQLSELDPKGVRTHSKKYIAKFRTLHFNLKSNNYFRSRVASGALDAVAIVAMHQEDLLSPEVRAEQEAEKARSLAQSVKEAAVQPKTKMTHKGEEILEENNQQESRVTERQGQNGALQVQTQGQIQPEETFDSFNATERSQSISAASPRMEVAPRFGSPPAMSPVISHSPAGPYSPTLPSRRDSMTFASNQPSASNSPDKATPAAAEGSTSPAIDSEEVFRPPMPHHARSDSASKVKLDLDAVWSNFKPAPVASPDKESAEPEVEEKQKEEDDMDVESSGDEELGEKQEDPSAVAVSKDQVEDYDPFASEGREKSSADDEFDLLMGDEDASAAAKAQLEGGATKSHAQETAPEDDLSTLPPVWEGSIEGVDEGSFPVRLVQVAGTLFGPHPAIWNRLLPQGSIEIKGRIGQPQASKYIMDSYFSPTREIIVLAMLSTEDKDTQFSDKSSGRYQHTLETYSKNGRFGAAPPPGEIAKVGKDCYVVPLKKTDPLPDFVVIQENTILPETGKRQQDYLLAVLVIRKGLGLEGARRTGSGGNTPLTQQASQEKVGAQPVPLPTGQFSPTTQAGVSTLPAQQQALNSAGASPLPGLDTTALQSLLSNPSLLQVLGASVPGASPVPGSVPPYGSFSPQTSQGMPGQSNAYGGAVTPAMGPVPASSHQSPPWNGGGPAVPPYPPQYGQPQHQQQQPWNPAGSPPWQGQSQGQGIGHQHQHQQRPQQAGWGVPPPGYIPPPGLGGAYIPPERIKAASAEARAIAERDRQERERRGAGGGGGGGNNNGPRHGGNQHQPGHGQRGGGNRGGWQGRNDQNGQNRKNGNHSNNQLNAGIQDRGWGNRS